VRRTVALAVIFALALVGCKKKQEPVTVQIAPNTEIPLILARKLEAGTDARGTVVPLMVAENVTSPDGKVLIAKGSFGYGMVMNSRSEGTLSSMLNKPARLEVRLDYVLAKDGQKIEISAEKNTPSEYYSFTRANTGNITALQNVERAWGESKKQEQMLKLMRLISESKYSDMSNDPETDQILTQLSSDLNLKYGNLQKEERDRVSSLLGNIGNGQINETKLSALAVPEISAIIELTKITGYVGQKIGGALKGRTIHAYVGTPLKGYTVKPEAVALNPEES
jgi:multidrug efflux pump subunit AcrA (membrane-fusion protein)